MNKARSSRLSFDVPSLLHVKDAPLAVHHAVDVPVRVEYYTRPAQLARTLTLLVVVTLHVRHLHVLQLEVRAHGAAVRGRVYALLFASIARAVAAALEVDEVVEVTGHGCHIFD